MGWLRNAWYESAARRELSSLAERLGLAMLPATAGWAPALVATVDQHAAAVRDILMFSGDRVGTVELAGYARGIQDVAREAGWSPVPYAHGPQWASDWVNLRLAAVCLLAVAGTVAVAMAGGDADPSVFF